MYYAGAYERISNKLLARQTAKPKPYCVLYMGKFLTGTQSLHNTAASRTWRLFWRIKSNRTVAQKVDI